MGANGRMVKMGTQGGSYETLLWPSKRVRDGKRTEALKGQSHERLCKLVMRSLEDRLGVREEREREREDTL